MATLVEITLHHVKAHQREELHEIKGEQGPLTRGATYNDWCDKEAEQECEEHLLPVQICYIDVARIYLQTPTTLVTVSAYTAIYSMKM